MSVPVADTAVWLCLTATLPVATKVASPAVRGRNTTIIARLAVPIMASIGRDHVVTVHATIRATTTRIGPNLGKGILYLLEFR